MDWEGKYILLVDLCLGMRRPTQEDDIYWNADPTTLTRMMQYHYLSDCMYQLYQTFAMIVIMS